MDREYLKDKKKIVIKIGSSSLIHEETGGLDYTKLEKLVRIICDLRNQDKDVVLVSSGAIGVGVQALGLARRPKTTSLRQACAAVGRTANDDISEAFSRVSQHSSSGSANI